MVSFMHDLVSSMAEHIEPFRERGMSLPRIHGLSGPSEPLPSPQQIEANLPFSRVRKGHRQDLLVEGIPSPGRVAKGSW